MTDELEQHGPLLEQIADSIVMKLRAGERASYEEYAERFPEYVDELKALLPALVLLEGHAAAFTAPDDGRYAGIGRYKRDPFPKKSADTGSFEKLAAAGWAWCTKPWNRPWDGTWR